MSRLPNGFRLRLSNSVRRYANGSTLVGGAPTTVMTLSSRAHSTLAGDVLVVEDDISAAVADRLLGAGLADPVLTAATEEGIDNVTVVVPVRDRGAALTRLLALLPEQVPVIVVDDASAQPDEVAGIAAGAGARLIRCDRNVGPAAARNLGLRATETEFVAFVDSDVRPDPMIFGQLLAHFADPRLAMVAPRIRGFVGATPRWYARYDGFRSSMDLGPVPAHVRPGSPVGWVPSACLMARRTALGSGFDEGLRVAEDVDVVWRLVEQGWRVRYDPQVSAGHDVRESMTAWWQRKLYYGTGAKLLADRHGSAVAPAVLNPFATLAVIALIARSRWSAPVFAVGVGGLATIIWRRIPPGPARSRITRDLTGIGLNSTLTQLSSLAVRSWWPVGVLAAAVSSRARRALLAAAVIDTVHAFAPEPPPVADVLPFAALKRLDDLAYGAGVWIGAIRGRSVRALLPDIRLRRRGRAPRSAT